MGLKAVVSSLWRPGGCSVRDLVNYLIIVSRYGALN